MSLPSAIGSSFFVIERLEPMISFIQTTSRSIFGTSKPTTPLPGIALRYVLYSFECHREVIRKTGNAADSDSEPAQIRTLSPLVRMNFRHFDLKGL